MFKLNLILSSDTKSFFSCFLPFFHLSSLGLKSTMFSTILYGGNHDTWRSSKPIYSEFTSFRCREKDAFSMFRDWSSSIFLKFKVKLKCQCILLHLKKSWRLQGSNASPVETQIYEAQALPLSLPARAIWLFIGQQW